MAAKGRRSRRNRNRAVSNLGVSVLCFPCFFGSKAAELLGTSFDGCGRPDCLDAWFKDARLKRAAENGEAA